MMQFCRYELRTSDVTAARAFYETILGGGIFDEGGANIIELPAEAAARGARPHWLGHIGVDDIETTARAFVERGATRLGPARPDPTRPDGKLAIFRDPGGAVVALASPPPAVSRANVVWHLLNTNDVTRTTETYRDVFGWHFDARLDLGPLGVFFPFAWTRDDANVGSMSDISERPGVHPHWLFQFPIEALDAALAQVRSAGGIVIEPVVLPNGDRIAVCDDPQGAAFALRESALAPQ